MAVVHRRLHPRRRSIVLWTVAGIVLLLLLVVLWVSVRALIARGELLGAIPLARSAQSAALHGDPAELKADVRDLQRRAASAASLTSDPVWRTVELVPLLGHNLTAFRQAARLTHDIADDALPPLTQLASTVTIDSFAPKNGQFDLQPFADAAPILGKARAALDLAGRQAAAIDTSGTIPQVGQGVDQVVELVNQTKQAIDGLDTAASLLPSMLGADGPRNYLLLSLNNAELRSTGGIPGAIAVVTADHGTLKLGTETSASALGEFAAPVLPLTKPERTLYQDILGTYMQDVTFTPDFARSGALAQAMWKQSTGQTIDGVVAVDPIALGYILNATGPVDAGGGVRLTSANAAKVLLSEVYSKFPVPADQDRFFAGVTSHIFGALTSGHVDSQKLVDALSKSADEGRIHVWSARPNEQKQLAGSTLAGEPLVSTRSKSAFGVYFNDSTGAKMDYYLRSAIGIGSAVCRADLRPNFDVRVSLSSTVATDAATSLPEYVTGGGHYGVAPGNVSTNVYVYAPKGALAYSVTLNGQQYSFVSAEHDGHSVAGISIDLAPGQTINLDVQFLGKAGAATAISLQHTPMSSTVRTSIDNYFDCPAQPTEKPNAQSISGPSVL